MLLQYDIENNLSVKSRQRIAFIADNKKELVNSEINILSYKVLPVIGLYGKNASGKTNLLKGLKHIYDMVILSHSLILLDRYHFILLLLLQMKKIKSQNLR